MAHEAKTKLPFEPFEKASVDDWAVSCAPTKDPSGKAALDAKEPCELWFAPEVKAGVKDAMARFVAPEDK